MVRHERKRYMASFEVVILLSVYFRIFDLFPYFSPDSSVYELSTFENFFNFRYVKKPTPIIMIIQIKFLFAVAHVSTTNSMERLVELNCLSVT